MPHAAPSVGSPSSHTPDTTTSFKDILWQISLEMLASPLVRHTGKWRIMEEGLILWASKDVPTLPRVLRRRPWICPGKALWRCSHSPGGHCGSPFQPRSCEAYQHCAPLPSSACFADLGHFQPPWASRLPRPCLTKEPKLMADGCRSRKTQPLCREGPFLFQSLSLESGCRWGFTCDHTRAWLPLPFPASQPFQASSGSLSLINHFHRNVWLRICFWENLISEALGRLLPLQLCTSLMAILRLKLALYRKKNLLTVQTVRPLHLHSRLRAFQQLGPSVQNSRKESEFLARLLHSFMDILPFSLCTNHFNCVLPKPFYSFRKPKFRKVMKTEQIPTPIRCEAFNPIF